MHLAICCARRSTRPCAPHMHIADFIGQRLLLFRPPCLSRRPLRHASRPSLLHALQREHDAPGLSDARQAHYIFKVSKTKEFIMMYVGAVMVHVISPCLYSLSDRAPCLPIAWEAQLSTAATALFAHLPGWVSCAIASKVGRLDLAAWLRQSAVA